MASNGNIRIVGISGSVRKESFNTALLREAANVSPNVQFTIADISQIPFFNEDLTEIPEPVTALKELIVPADAVVIATPEYNGMISGVLKNALEWLSRSTIGHPLSEKPVGIIGASTTAFGTSAAQVQLRQLAFALNMHVLNRPVVRVANAAQKFDGDGNLTDEQTKETLSQFMTSLVEWTMKLK